MGRAGEGGSVSDLQRLASREVSYWKRLLERKLNYASYPAEVHAGGEWICPMCPVVLSYSRKAYLLNHVNRAHWGAALGCPSTKQERVMRCVWDSAYMEDRARAAFNAEHESDLDYRPVSDSAKKLRQQLEKSPARTDRVNSGDLRVGEYLDRHTVVLLDVPEARYILREDANGYHRLSAQYWATDAFVGKLLSSMIDPVTRGAQSRVLRDVGACMDWTRGLLPADHRLYHTACEGLLDHAIVKDVLQRAREAQNRAVISIDGQYSALLGVLYQVPHGTKRKDADGVEGNVEDEVHAMLTMATPDAVLLVKAAPSEAPTHHVAAIQEGIGEGGAALLRLLLSDEPVVLDTPALRAAFIYLRCVCKDPIHIALKIEKASGEKVTTFSLLIRKCVFKFRHGHDDGKAYYTKTVKLPRARSLADVAAGMTLRQAKNHRSAIEKDSYKETPYKSVGQFVQDEAAIVKLLPDAVRRKIEGGTTVRASLEAATAPAQAEYLMNLSRFVARNPTLTVPYGTTKNEAFHNQLKGYFREVVHQTRRNAEYVARVATLAKLVAASVDSARLTREYYEADVLRAACRVLVSSPPTITPLLELKTVPNPKVDEAMLAAGAKRWSKATRTTKSMKGGKGAKSTKKIKAMRGTKSMKRVSMKRVKAVNMMKAMAKPKGMKRPRVSLVEEDDVAMEE